MKTNGEVTRLLDELTEGRPAAAEQLLPLVYDELRSLADRYLRGESPDHTLQPTALVHEAYIRLVDGCGREWQGRNHFFAVAAVAMRRILTDAARRRQAAKRGGDRCRVSLTEAAEQSDKSDAYMVALDDALTELASIDSQLSRVVELRFFGGMSVDETARLLQVAPITVSRRWKMAKGWLHREISKEH